MNELAKDASTPNIDVRKSVALNAVVRPIRSAPCGWKRTTVRQRFYTWTFPVAPTCSPAKGTDHHSREHGGRQGPNVAIAHCNKYQQNKSSQPRGPNDDRPIISSILNKSGLAKVLFQITVTFSAKWRTNRISSLRVRSTCTNSRSTSDCSILRSQTEHGARGNFKSAFMKASNRNTHGWKHS